jgi:hypothetical protein
MNRGQALVPNVIGQRYHQAVGLPSICVTRRRQHEQACTAIGHDQLAD